MRQLLNARISVSRQTYSQSNNMGIDSTAANVYTNVPASIQPATSAVQYFYSQRQIQITQTIFVAGSLALVRGDSISDGTTSYEVRGWRDLSGRGRVFAIDCQITEV